MRLNFLSVDVVAEGVETPEHAKAAREAGCHALQGYLYARPLDVAEATNWLAHTEQDAGATDADEGAESGFHATTV